MAAELIRIVSRSSPMALAQVERVRAELAALHPGIRTEVVPVTTSGDKWMGDLARLGGKGAFTKEVDQALLDGRADLAVHCLKDIPADRPLPEGCTFAAYLKRDDVRDALIDPKGRTLDELPEGTRVGTSSVRRIAQLAASHPHVECVPMRGNANRRLEKLAAGDADVLLLALSGLERIGRTDVVTEVLTPEVMCPPIGAGILALQCRADDERTLDTVSGLGYHDTWREATAERMFLHVLQGHCNSPVAGYARAGRSGDLSLRACVFTPDGKRVLNAQEWAGPLDPATLGMSVAVALLRQGARELIDGIAH
ncbi:hydroxymethylbilane synthase [Streptomyces sp. VRA16 Mangrove soil]|uniref:hydroxymethylbilane synthase n=1 Tax=Streptomyces sp. VRA16 Mangrove soil TaxID=2817434 RepID=UPI001A9FF404|nr:hydroxymethylbilane synthase [Streptomyces sp. VRA16 Mangrove soil]MBO1330329.1 hydroxymethylbilane synthase [Streptomyces sp. VRA16 Mangrove soil]